MADFRTKSQAVSRKGPIVRALKDVYREAALGPLEREDVEPLREDESFWTGLGRFGRIRLGDLVRPIRAFGEAQRGELTPEEMNRRAIEAAALGSVFGGTRGAGGAVVRRKLPEGPVKGKGLPIRYDGKSGGLHWHTTTLRSGGEKQPWVFSQLMRSLEARQAAGTKAMKGQNLLKELQKAGVKKAELEWTGLDKMLNTAEKVPLANVVQQAQERAIKLKTQKFGSRILDSTPPEEQQWEVVLPDSEGIPEQRFEIRGTIEEAAAIVEELGISFTDPNLQVSRIDQAPYSDTRWSQYLEPFEWTPSYGETVLRLEPRLPKGQEDDLRAAKEGAFPEEIAPYHHQLHYSDLDNVVGWLRHDTRKTIEGKRGFMIQELQGDWARALRERGPYNPEEVAELERETARVSGLQKAYADAAQRLMDRSGVKPKFATPRERGNVNAAREMEAILKRLEMSPFFVDTSELSVRTASAMNTYARTGEVPLRISSRNVEELKQVLLDAGLPQIVSDAQETLAGKLPQYDRGLKLGQAGRDKTTARLMWLRSRLDALRENPPDMPYKEGGDLELLLKRALYEAAEGGYDELLWTTPEQQIQRWQGAGKVFFPELYGERVPRTLERLVRQASGKKVKADETAVELGPGAGAPSPQELDEGGFVRTVNEDLQRMIGDHERRWNVWYAFEDYDMEQPPGSAENTSSDLVDQLVEVSEDHGMDTLDDFIVEDASQESGMMTGRQFLEGAGVLPKQPGTLPVNRLKLDKFIREAILKGQKIAKRENRSYQQLLEGIG